jgi:hypothetical protein
VRSIAWARRNHSSISRRHDPAVNVPSWSWASIGAGIDSALPAIRFPWRASSADPLDIDEDFEILDASCTTAGANKFGNVSGGSIRLRGTLVLVRLSHDYSISGSDLYQLLFEDTVALFLADVTCQKSSGNVLELVSCWSLAGGVGSRSETQKELSNVLQI